MRDRFEEGRRALDDVTPTADLWEEAEQRATVSPSSVEHSRDHRRPLVAAAAIALVAAVGIVAFANGGDDSQVDTGPAVSPAEEPAITIPAAPPCGPLTIAGGPVQVHAGAPAAPVFPKQPDLDRELVGHASDGPVQLELHVPGIVVRDLVGERVEPVELARGEAQLWITEEFSQVRWFTGGQDRCASFTVTASGGTQGEERAAAVSLADRVVLATDEGRSEPDQPTSTTSEPSHDDSFAIWPETDRSHLSAEEPPWSLDMNQTALVFADMVLGWDDAVVTDGEPSEDGRRGGILSVESPARNGYAEISVAPLVGDRYRVYGVDSSTGSDESFASVSVQGSTASADAGPAPEGTASTRVRFSYGGVVTEGTAGEEFELVAPPSGAGSVLVLFLDAAGEVIGAWGTPLPSGDFAAG